VSELFNLERLLLLGPAFLFAITVHEFSHGYVAYRLGDPTAKLQGRLSFNPLVHLDLFGTIALLFVGFGWAKPVPVNPFNFSNPRRDNLWVSLAGPASNFLSAFAFGLTYRMLEPVLRFPGTGQIVLTMILLAVWINLVLAVFNLLPFPPLDGFHILEGLVPESVYPQLESFARVGPLILLGLIMISSFGGVGIFRILFNPILSIFGTMFTGHNLAF